MKAPGALFRTVMAAGAVLLLVASSRPTAAQEAAAPASSDQASKPEVAKQLAELRQATEKFKDFNAAKAAGYTVEVTKCMDALPAGTMGFHYGNNDYINDPVPDVRKPELLMYEPDENGRMQLVGVEYMIPYKLVPANTTPKPTLFGLPFENNGVFGIWALHAWVWKENPNGVFFDWNPSVTCKNAGENVTHLGATH